MSKKKIFWIVGLVVIAGLVALGVFSHLDNLEELDQDSLYLLKSGEDTPGITIDGKIDKGEWDSFKWRETESRALTVYLTNDATYLYLAIKAKRDRSENPHDYGLLGFLMSEEREIEAGKFKTINIRADGLVLWQAWDRAERLPVKHAWDYEAYADNLSARVKTNEAVRVYHKTEIVDGKKERLVYAYFAENITDIPEGLEGKTTLTHYRHYEFKIPLSALGLKVGETVKVFGYVYNATSADISSRSRNIHYPNFRTKFLASPWYGVEIVPPPPQ